MITRFDLTGTQQYLKLEEIARLISENEQALSRILTGDAIDPAEGGWFLPSKWISNPLVDEVEALAEKIRAEAEVFVLVGIGGSNRGAQSLIEALGGEKVEILYAGDNLSSHALQKILAKIEGRQVYLNVIAKDFNTLEPGIVFRVLRQYMERIYGEAAKKRIILTGSTGGGQLYQFSQTYGCKYLPFLEDLGGRFSVLSPVGFLPAAVAGVDIRQIIQGACAAERQLKAGDLLANPAAV
jgi:glucose-6-phosphate isomerase